MCNLTSKLRRVYFNILPKNSLVVSVCDFGGGVELSIGTPFAEVYHVEY